MICENIILASSSPRRKELLSWIVNDFQCEPGNIDETPAPGELPVPYTERMAIEKADKALSLISTDKEAFIIGSDTTVYADHRICGKPQSPAHAIEMLHFLNGRSHLVCTATALIHTYKGAKRTFYTIAETVVHFRHMSDDEIEDFVSTGVPMGKAGSYAIQDVRFHPVQSIEGCYACVIGLPLCHVKKLFSQFDIEYQSETALLCKHHFGFNCPGNPRISIQETGSGMQKERFSE